MIVIDDMTHGYFIARTARTGFDPEVDHVISRVTRNGELMGGIIFTGYTGSMVRCHVAGVENWAHPELVWIGFDYPFMQLGVRKILVSVGAANTRSKSIIERLGFTLEHAIEDGTAHGPLYLYSMLREDCRYLKLRSRYLKANGHAKDHFDVHAEP